MYLCDSCYLPLCVDDCLACSFLYMFRATMCPSSGEITVSMPQLLFVTLYRWLSGMYTRQSSTLSDKYQVSHRYSYFSWWWAHSRPKHVEKRNKHTKKSCAPSWLYLQDYTRMHGQQNIKFDFFNSSPVYLQTFFFRHCHCTSHSTCHKIPTITYHFC